MRAFSTPLGRRNLRANSAPAPKTHFVFSGVQLVSRRFPNLLSRRSRMCISIFAVSLEKVEGSRSILHLSVLEGDFLIEEIEIRISNIEMTPSVL